MGCSLKHNLNFAQEGRIFLSVMRVCLHFTAISCFLFNLIFQSAFVKFYTSHLCKSAYVFGLYYILFTFSATRLVFLYRIHFMFSWEIVRQSSTLTSTHGQRAFIRNGKKAVVTGILSMIVPRDCPGGGHSHWPVCVMRLSIDHLFCIAYTECPLFSQLYTQ